MSDQLAYPVPDAAKQLGISRSRMYVLRDEGAIEFTRIGGRVVVKRSELERFLNEQPVTSGRAGDQ